jgi:hypothetical protein
MRTTIVATPALHHGLVTRLRTDERVNDDDALAASELLEQYRLALLDIVALAADDNDPRFDRLKWIALHRGLGQ